MKTRDVLNELRLRQASARGNITQVEKLLKENKNININSKSTASGKTALHRAAEDGHIALVAYLLESKADLSVGDNKGRSPLHWATYRGQTKMIKYLVEKGVNPNIRDDDGRAPMHYAFRKCS